MTDDKLMTSQENISTSLQKIKKFELKPSKYQKIVTEEDEKGVFEGQKLFGKRHGKGVFTFTSGYRFEGNWVNDNIEGQGSLFYPDGSLAYEGQWANGKLDGEEDKEIWALANREVEGEVKRDS